MIKQYSLRLCVFLICCFFSIGAIAQINTPAGAVVPFNANPKYANGIMPKNLPTSGAYGKSTDAANAYNEWKANYAENCGSGKWRVKFDDPTKTVSEGIAYGMLLSAYAADKTLFDGLWNYYIANSTNGFLNWKINGCSGIAGTGGATDADLDAAFALMIAETQWPTSTSPYTYKTEANRLIDAIKQSEIASNGQAINGNGWGFGNDCRNPSYQSPAYYKAYKGFRSDASWDNAVSGGYNLINSNAHATTGLVSDWSSSGGTRNLCNPSGTGSAPTDGYGYDACRNPWRMAQDAIWNNDARATAILGKITTYLNGRGAANVRGPVYQDGGLYTGNAHNATFVSTFAVAVMGSTNQTLMDQMYTETVNTKDLIQNQTLSGYYGNTLRCISLFMMTGNFWPYGTKSEQEINVRQGSVNIENKSTFDFQNGQINVGKSLDFTIENLGFAPLTLSGSPRVVLTPATDFTVTTQPASGTLALNANTVFTVKFNPTSAGLKTATITIANNDADEGSYTITLVGTGTTNATAPKLVAKNDNVILANSGTFDLGNVTAGATGTKKLKIINNGDAPLNLSKPTPVTDFISGGTHATSYSVTSTLPMTIAKGDSAYLTISFIAPSTIPSNPDATATLKLVTDDPSYASFTLTLKSKIVSCSTSIAASKVLTDYDGNYNVKHTWDPKPAGAFSQATANPSATGLNLSATVASYNRPATGKFEIIRYFPCSGTYFDGLSAATPAISMLVYSPAVGIKVTLAAQTGTDAAAAPIYEDYSSNVNVSTTKANQWERLTFDLSKVVKNGDVSKFTILDIQVDPELGYTGWPAKFYIDDIKYSGLPCVNDLPTSQVLLDFDNHNNISLDYTVSSLDAPVTNAVSGGLNTSSNVGRFIKSASAGVYSDGLRYNGCGGVLDLSSKKIISMLVYSTVADAPIQISAKIPDGTDTDTYPDDAATATGRTIFANKWHRIYFDLSAIKAAQIPNVFAIDINFDPNNTKKAQTYYFDDIRYETAAPCIAGIPATKILNDFDDNRYLDIAFPGSFNTIFPNPSTTGINNSATAGQFVRDAGTNSGTSFRFKACQSNIDLGPGKAVINLMVNSPNAGVTFIMSLKNAAGTDLSSVEATTTGTAGVWEELSFDHSAILNSTDVAFIDVIVDPNAVYSAAGSLAAARTYLVDNLRYGYVPAQPEINVRAQTVPPTDVLTTKSFNMGTVSVGDSSAAITFSIQNNGLVDLLLNGTPDLAIGGANPGDFIITKNPTYTTTVGALSASNFVVRFKPTAGGARSASITIKNNDSNEGTYIIYLNGTAKQPTMSVKQGATVYNAVSAAYDFGTSLLNTATTPVTFTITSTGDDTLRLSGTPVITITGTNAADFSVTQPVVTKLHPSTGTVLTTTFTVTFKPTTSGAKNAVINIGNNSSSNPYTFKVTGSGDCPLPTAALAGPDQSTCDATATLAGNIPTVGAGAWSIVGTSSATITTPTSSTSTVGNLTAGQSVTLRWTITNGTCGTSTDDVIITRNVTPSVTFPAVSSVCAGGSVDLFPTVTGGTQPYTYTWTASSGTVPAGAIPTVTPSTTTTYSLVVKDANNCSNVAAQKVISVNAKPVLAVTPATSDICSGGSALLTASATGGTAPYSYAWDSAPALVINSDKATASPSVTSTYFVTASDANGCTSDKKSALVNVTSGGVATVTISPATVAVCDGTPVTLTATGVNGGVPTYEWFVNGSKVTAGVNGAEFTSSTLPNNAQITVKMTSSIACATGSPATSSATTVTVNALPAVAVNTSAAEICNGGSVNVNAVVTGGKAPYTYVWTSSIGNKPADAGSTLSPVETTTYSVQVTDANNCKNTVAASKQVVVNGKPSVAVTPSSTDVCTGQSAVLTANVTGGTAPYSYQWTNVVGTSSSVTVAPTTETIYSVVVSDSKNCQSAAATSVVKVSSSVEANVTIVSSSDKACDAGTNATFTLTSQGGGASPVYSWTVNNIAVGLSAETYSGLVKPGDVVKVTMTSSLACATGSPATSNVITLANAGNICVVPAKKVVTGPTSVTAGDEATYMTDAAAVGSVYTWSLPAGATIVSANADNSVITVKFGSTGGNVVLHETNPAGTTDSDPINVVVTPAGISALLNSSVNVMPNPGVDFVVTLGDAFAGNVNIIVKNALGTSVLEENVFKGSSSADYNVNLTGFASGVYFLEIRTEQGNAVKRLIKQ